MKTTLELVRFNEVDSDGDIFTPGSFANQNDTVPLLSDFNPDQPLGLGKLISTPTALMVEVDLPDDVLLGRVASIGFNPNSAHGPKIVAVGLIPEDQKLRYPK